MSLPTLFEKEERSLSNLREASVWASQYLNRKVTVANLSYLIQYGKITKHSNNGSLFLDLNELKQYYDALEKEQIWKNTLGEDLNWRLSFVEYKEAERTKHVHRLHPYKGKFIPQLVEYFLDSHTDEFKREVYFQPNDIVLDPFCGSGTTLVQANELGLHAIGIDISAFNVLITNIKCEKHDIPSVLDAIQMLTCKLEAFQNASSNAAFESHLLTELSKFNSKYFPSPEYRRSVSKGEIDELKYAAEKEKEFLEIYFNLVNKYKLKIKQDNYETFLSKWFLSPVKEEIDFLFNELKAIENKDIKKVLSVILSRTVRSCRATNHADLATLKEPVTTTYYCKKHGKICKPIFSIMGWWKTYTIDTIKRFKEFDNLRTNTYQLGLIGDSRTIDIFSEVQRKKAVLSELLLKQKIKGIFSSPPYVGLIDYHEQHAYAYEIFGFKRQDELEISPLSKGQGREAQRLYIKDIAEVLNNCKKYLQDDFNIFLVANDKFNLYPKIAELSGMRIVNQFKRPVLCRVEKDRENAYAETIFHFKEK